MGTLIVHPKDKEQLSVLKAFMKALKISFEESKDNLIYNAEFVGEDNRAEEPNVVYNQAFVKKIRQSEEEFNSGNYKSVKTEDLWK